MRSAISLLLLFGLLAGATVGQDDFPGISVLKVVSEKPDHSDALEVDKIRRKLLETDVELSLVDTPLQEATQHLAQRLEVPIRIQERALADVALSSDEPVSIDLRGVRCVSVLRMILRQLDLTYYIEPTGIVITTSYESESHLETRFCPLGDLLYHAPVQPGSQPDFDSIIEVLTTTIAPDSWGEGNPHLPPYGEGLVLPQTQDVQEHISRVLDAVRQAKSMPSDAYDTRPILASPLAERTAKLRQLLSEKTVSFQFQDTPLDEVVKTLNRSKEFQVAIDVRGLEDVGLEASYPVTWNVSDVSLADALDQLAEAYYLNWSTVGRLVIVSAPSEYDTELETRVYPIRDLLWHGLDVSDPKLRDVLRQNAYGGSGGAVDIFRAPWQLEVELDGVPPMNDYDSLIEALTAVEGESWEELGGPGSIAPFPQADCLVITQTVPVHEQLIRVLAEIRQDQKPLDPEFVMKKINEARERAFAVSYEMADSRFGNLKLSREDLARIAARVKTLMAADSWDGDELFIDATEQGLVVRHRADVQLEVFDFLRRLGFHVKPDPVTSNPPGGFGGGGRSNESGTPKQPTGDDASPASQPKGTNGATF